MSEEAVAQVQAFTGLGAEEAKQFLEMSGGDVEGAVNLFFGMSGDGNPGAAGASADASASDWPSWVTVIFDRGTQPSEAWTEQEVACSDHKGEEIGLVQHKNGPCGVLATLNAILVAERLRKGQALNTKFSRDEFASAIASIIRRCVPDDASKAVICSWRTDRHGAAIETDDVAVDRLSAVVAEGLDAFLSKGGLLLLVFSCVATHGPDLVKTEALAGGGEPPLIVGPNQLCTSELLKLLLCGAANGSVGAYSLMGGKTPDLSTVGGVGLLSLSELQSSIPVADSLKAPPVPVWIIHSNDHFTFMFCDTIDAKADPPVEVMHFNGLPPAGPRMCRVRVTGDKVADKAPEVKKDAYFKPEPGEIEDIVQVDPADKTARPGQFKTWKYEAVLAIDDPSVTGPPRPADADPPKVFPQGQPGTGAWRCASCYRDRFKTMNFGGNDAGTTHCAACGKSRADAGWALWLSYDELPRTWQRKMRIRYGAAVSAILHTKWPDCELELLSSSRSSKQLPSV